MENHFSYLDEFEEIINTGPFPIRFPKAEALTQDKEWCEVKIENQWKKIRFHDYSEVYAIPGLYETIFYRTLRCNSPSRITSLLNEALIEHNFLAQNLRVLDFGAGNGMAGEALQSLGTRSIIGLDILPQARDATLRDRPWVYNNYFVKDFTSLSNEDFQLFKDYKFNALTTVAALGFGDIPVKAFYTAFNLIEDQGWVAFNIKEDFLKVSNHSGFSGLINFMIQKEIMQIEVYKRYQHRLNVMGQPLYYIVIVAKKLRDLSDDEVQQLEP